MHAFEKMSRTRKLSYTQVGILAFAPSQQNEYVDSSEFVSTERKQKSSKKERVPTRQTNEILDESQPNLTRDRGRC